MIKQITGVISLTTMLGSPMVASADWTDDWMMDFRYNYAVASDASGSDSTTVGSRVTSFSGDGIEGESSFGIGIGKEFDGVSVTLAYETMSADNNLDGLTMSDGTLFTQLDQAVDVDTFMLEVAGRTEMSEVIDAVLLAGLGFSSFEVSATSFTGATTAGPIASATLNAGNFATDSDDVSIRIGGGLDFKVSETVSIATLLQYTNYGTYEQTTTGDDGNLNILSVDLEATELSMRLRFMF